MTTTITVTLAPMGDQHLPTCRLGGTDKTIPVITWSDDIWSPASVELQLGNHHHPSTYLRSLAARLVEFADEVDVALRAPAGTPS